MLHGYLPLGEQGWRCCESARLPPMRPRFHSRTQHMSCCSFYTLRREVFLAGTPVLPSPEKSTFPNSNSILEYTDFSERVLVNSLVLRFLHLLYCRKRAGIVGCIQFIIMRSLDGIEKERQTGRITAGCASWCDNRLREFWPSFC